MAKKKNVAEQLEAETPAAADAATIRRLRAEKRRLAEQVGNWEALTQAFVDYAPSLPRPRKPKLTGTPSRYPREMVALLSDTHSTEFWTKAQTDGLTEYNFEIFCSQLWYYGQEIIRIAEEERGRYGVKVLHVDLLGDIYHGMLRIEDEVTNEFPSTVGMANTAFVLMQWLLLLVEHFDKIHCTCMAGNHGRLHLKPQSKRYVGENRDTAVYLALRNFARLMKIEDRLTFTIPACRVYTMSRMGHRIKLGHGDHIKGGNGISQLPIFGISRAILRELSREIRSGRGEKIALIEYGHWHHPNYLEGMTLINGPFCNTAPWAFDELGAYAEPKQWVYFVSERFARYGGADLSLKHGAYEKHGFTYDAELGK